jgi:ABC-2 type transport system permease protein
VTRAETATAGAPRRAGLAGMRPALSAEWTKLASVPGTGWLLLGLIAATGGLGVLTDAATTCSAGGCRVDPAKVSLTGLYLGQAIVVIFACAAISGEYSTGMIRVTFTAMPRRTAVLAAKAAIVTGPVLAAGALAVLGSVLAGRLILPGHGFTAAHGYPPLDLGDGPVLRAAAGSVLYLGLIGLLSLGVAALARDTALAVGAMLGLLYVVPILAAVLGNSQLARHLQQLAPMTAGLAIQATTTLRSQPISPWAGLGVLAAWAAAALVTGGLLLRFRDA